MSGIAHALGRVPETMATNFNASTSLAGHDSAWPVAASAPVSK